MIITSGVQISGGVQIYDIPIVSAVGTPYGSVAFNGSTQYLDIASTTAFGFGTADFTIEFWWRPTVNQRSDVLDFWSTGLGASITSRFDIGRITGSTLDLYTDSPVGGGGSSNKITGPTIASLLNTWVHVAVTRESGAIKMWVNGTQAGSTYTARVLDMGASMQLRIMGDHNASGNGSGNLSNVRVVRGVAVYTGTFTPPTSALALTQSSGTNISAITAGQTQLLLPLNASPFTDSSTNAITLTNTGTIVPGVQYPFTAYDATGTYPVTVVNPTPRVLWNSTNGGVFRVTTASNNNFLTFGPNYSSGTQAFTVGMAYKWNGVTAGRLLNANTASPDFLMGLWGNGVSPRMNIAFANGFTGTSDDIADTAWHFIWFSSTGTAGASKSKSYIATSTAPTTTYGTSSTNGGFNGLRLFSRFFNTTTSTEQVDADVGFVKVWDKELSLAEIQAEHATYKTRFGY